MLSSTINAASGGGGGLLLHQGYQGNFALNFSAAHKDIVRVPHHDMMNHPLIDSWSLEAWVWPTKQQKHPGEGNIINIVGFPLRHPVLGMTSDGFACTQLRDVKGRWYTYQGTTSLTDGKWHHIAATWDGRSQMPSDNKLALYVDGELEEAGGMHDGGKGEPQTPGVHGYTAAAECTPGLCEEGMHIGGLYCCQGGGYTGRFFSGTIDEVRVWTRELAPTEILARMRKPLQAQDENGLLFYFPFDDAGMEMGTNVVESKALSWWGILGTSMGVSRPIFSISTAPLACTAGSRAPACTLQSAVAAYSSARSSWLGLASGKAGYSLFTIIAAVLSTMALTVTLTSILTHAFITGRVVLPPGLSNLSNIFLRILPGSDYRRTPNIEDVDSSHRSDWTWASPARA